MIKTSPDKTQPVYVLHYEFGVKLSHLHAMMPPRSRYDTTALLASGRRYLSPKLQRHWFKPAMVYWGQEFNNRNPKRRLLWDYYFEGYKPHIYHILSFIFYYTDPELCRVTGTTPKQLDKWLRRPRLSQRMLQKAAPEAMKLKNALQSPNRTGGVDSRYSLIHRALKDRKRLYDKHEMVVD